MDEETRPDVTGAASAPPSAAPAQAAKMKLIEAATAAREAAYAPYSKFRVGAALLCADGTVFTGANVENASYALTVCAERTAIATAVCAGHRDFAAIAVVTDADGCCPPCGACLQVMWEFNPDMPIIMTGPNGQERITTVRTMLPDGFRSFKNCPVT